MSVPEFGGHQTIERTECPVCNGTGTVTTSWDVRDPATYAFTMGVTILQLLDSGRFKDEGLLLGMSARKLMYEHLLRGDSVG